MNLPVTFLDILVILIVLVSAGYAAWKGFLWETLTIFDWLAAGRASLGDLTPVLPLEDGPHAFARLAQAPPDQVKVFLAGAGRG